MVHQRARRLRRRRHAAGAGVLAATLAAGLVGAEYLGGSGGASRLATPAAGPPSGSSSCPKGPGSPAQTAVAQPPAVGQEFTGGGVVVAPSDGQSVMVDVPAGPLAGSVVTLGITSATKVTVANADGSGETPAPAGQLRKGQTVKFTATRTGATTYVAKEIHTGPTATSAGGAKVGPDTGLAGAGPGGAAAAEAAKVATGAAAAEAAKVAAGAAARGGTATAGAPADSAGFKVQGVVVAVTAHSLTLKVDTGTPTGTVTFALASGVTCQPQALRPGDRVLVGGVATRAATYEADVVAPMPPAPAPATG
jgi:hypothetical protein